MNGLIVPVPRPPTHQQPPACPRETLLDVRARRVLQEPGLWVWSVFDGVESHLAHGFGDDSLVARWIQDRWDGPLVLRGPTAEHIAGHIPGSVPDTSALPLHDEARAMREREDAVVRGLGRLQIATDGSSANGCSAAAWVAADGRHGARGWWSRHGSRQANALRAEFEAVAAAVDAMHPSRPLELLVDSSTVVADVRRAIEGLAVRHGAKIPGWTVCALAERDVRVRWVKGHSGHAMNDVADRLAVHARRSAEMGSKPTAEVMTSIVEGVAQTA